MPQHTLAVKRLKLFAKQHYECKQIPFNPDLGLAYVQDFSGKISVKKNCSKELKCLGF